MACKSIELKVKRGQLREAGLDIVRVYDTKSVGLKRWGVAKVTCDGKNPKHVIVLGQDKDKGCIWLNYDLRRLWDIPDVPGERKYEFIFCSTSIIGQVWFLATATNPIIRVPMNVALVLGGVSILLSLLGLLCG